MSTCPDEAQVVAYARGLLAAPRAQALEAHLDGCPLCCQLVALSGRDPEAAADAAHEPGRAAELAPGAALGRYAILELVGRGAMGSVYAAYDRELDRRVALKLLRPEAEGGEQAGELSGRLLREARTMAQLSHPNIVAVHDVGTFEGSVFLAMDFVHGKTLRQWLRDAPRTWREILRVFLDAGRGLAAAHARGIVHRDFKPDNVLVDIEGRVFVADFGLARGTRDVAPNETAPSASPVVVTSGPAFQATMTATGVVLGTPAYMAPEQYEGSSSPRSDVFAFGVALYEALYGVHPFPTDTLPMLREAIGRKRLKPPPKGVHVPRFLAQAVMRALDPSPEARWPSMATLVAALSADPRRRLRLMAVPAAVVLLCGAATLAYFSGREDPAARCRWSEQRLAGVWDAERSEAVRAAFAKTDVVYAAESAEIARRTLSAYASRWADARREACEATHVRGEQSQDLLDRRMQCLDDRLRDLRALARAFASADARTVEKATRAAAALRDVAECADRRRLRERVQPPRDPRTAAEVETVRAELAHVRALEVAGHLEEALGPAAAAVTRARALGYRPLVAEALYRLGKLQRARTEHRTAVATLHASEVAASAARADELAVRTRLAVIEPLTLLGLRDEAVRTSEQVLARVEGMRAGPLLRADALLEQARALQESDHAQAAEAPLREGIALVAETTRNADDPRLAVLFDYLSGVLMNSGRAGEAVRFAARAAALSERTHGAQHPLTASMVAQLGVARMTDGRLAQAEADLRRALAIQERVLAPDHLYRLATRSNVAEVLFLRGHYAAALREIEPAVAARNRISPRSFDAFIGRRNRARFLIALGRLDEASREADELLAWAARDFGRDKVCFGIGLTVSGHVLERRGRFADALASYRQAIPIFTRAEDLDELHVARLGEQRVLRQLGRAPEALRLAAGVLAFYERRQGVGVASTGIAVELGKARAEVGDLAGARAVLERAVAFFESRREDVALVRLADTKLALAQVLARAPREERRARALALQAKAHLAAAPHPVAELQAAVRRLLGRLGR